MARPKIKPSSYDEMLLMLKVFKCCIKTKIIPAINSPCHFKVIEIIDRSKSNRKSMMRKERDV